MVQLSFCVNTELFTLVPARCRSPISKPEPSVEIVYCDVLLNIKETVKVELKQMKKDGKITGDGTKRVEGLGQSTPLGHRTPHPILMFRARSSIQGPQEQHRRRPGHHYGCKPSKTQDMDLGCGAVPEEQADLPDRRCYLQCFDAGEQSSCSGKAGG